MFEHTVWTGKPALFGLISNSVNIIKRGTQVGRQCSMFTVSMQQYLRNIRSGTYGPECYA